MKSGKRELPKVDVNVVLIDVDDTISYSEKSNNAENCTFLSMLGEIVAEIKGVSMEEAFSRINKVGNPDNRCLFNFLPDLGISKEIYWQRIQEHLSKHLKLYEDAAVLIKGLSKRGIKLYPATTNARMAILSKLAVFGLASIDGSPYFTDVLGGDEVCPGGKSSPEFFYSLIRKFELDPAKTLMVGDSPQADLGFARTAGIEQVVLPRREQKETFVKEKDGGIYVRSLELVLDMIA